MADVRAGSYNNCIFYCFHQATCKHERKIAALRTQQQHIHKRMEEATVRFLENDGWLHRVENEMKLLGPNAQAPEVSRTICDPLEFL